MTMRQFESLAIAIKYLEDNDFNVENSEQILDDLTDMLWEKICDNAKQSSDKESSSEELTTVDRLNKLITHTESYVDDILLKTDFWG